MNSIKLINGAFELEGQKDHVCLLLHGLGGGAYEMSLLGQYLHSNGYSTKAITYPGHHQTSEFMPKSDWTEWYEHADESLDLLMQKYSKVSLIGFSTGCPLSIKLALNYQDKLNQLILLSPFINLKYHWFYLLPLEYYINAFGTLVGAVPRKVTRLCDDQMSHIVSKVRKFKTFNLHAVKSALQLISEIKPDIPKIKLPTLIIQSKQDRVVDPHGAQYILSHLTSKVKELLWLYKSNHTLTLDLEREIVNEKILQFFTDNEQNNYNQPQQ